MQYTENYNLAKPDGTDNVEISVLNENMTLIDEILADIYSKLPTPPQPVTDLISLDVNDTNFTYVEAQGGYIHNDSTTALGLVADTQYVCKLIAADSQEYSITATAYDFEGRVTVEFDPDQTIPSEISELLNQISITDGIHMDLTTLEPVEGGYFLFLAVEDLSTFSSVVSKITVNPVE
jgi:hypothetical protein